ncbi:MAG: hypothetical protein NT076_03700 [Candidatus Pacearchaeota archaeon]|nr:hypothetical protein [Candidatus Pacearchaeota archaeon]
MKIPLEEAVSHERLQAVITGVLRKYKYEPHWEYVFFGGRQKGQDIYVLPGLLYTRVYVPWRFGINKVEFRIPAVDGRFGDIDYFDYRSWVSDIVILEVEKRLRNGKTD